MVIDYIKEVSVKFMLRAHIKFLWVPIAKTNKLRLCWIPHMSGLLVFFNKSKENTSGKNKDISLTCQTREWYNSILVYILQ